MGWRTGQDERVLAQGMATWGTGHRGITAAGTAGGPVTLTVKAEHGPRASSAGGLHLNPPSGESGLSALPSPLRMQRGFCALHCEKATGPAVPETL